MPSIKIRKMQTAPLKLIEIQRDLPLLSERKLEEVKDFVGFILAKSGVPKRRVVKLKGIWQNKGFEKIDIESELKSIRKETSDSILRREI
jgi:hypothetical protein